MQSIKVGVLKWCRRCTQDDPQACEGEALQAERPRTVELPLLGAQKQLRHASSQGSWHRSQYTAIFKEPSQAQPEPFTAIYMRTPAVPETLNHNVQLWLGDNMTQPSFDIRPCQDSTMQLDPSPTQIHARHQGSAQGWQGCHIHTHIASSCYGHEEVHLNHATDKVLRALLGADKPKNILASSWCSCHPRRALICLHCLPYPISCHRCLGTRVACSPRTARRIHIPAACAAIWVPDPPLHGDRLICRVHEGKWLDGPGEAFPQPRFATSMYIGSDTSCKGARLI